MSLENSLSRLRRFVAEMNAICDDLETWCPDPEVRGTIIYDGPNVPQQITEEDNTFEEPIDAE